MQGKKGVEIVEVRVSRRIWGERKGKIRQNHSCWAELKEMSAAKLDAAAHVGRRAPRFLSLTCIGPTYTCR